MVLKMGNNVRKRLLKTTELMVLKMLSLILMKALCFDSGDVDAIDSGGDDSKEEDEFVFV